MSLTAFFGRAEQDLAERGLTVSIGDQRAELTRLQDRWGYDTYPAFRPMIREQCTTGIFWQGDSPVATMAGAPYLLDGTLTEHLFRWGLYTGVSIALWGDAKTWADTVTGRACFTGGFCMPQKLRGSELSRWLVPLMSRYIRAACLHRYSTPDIRPPCFFFVPESKRLRGERYNPERLVGKAKFSNDDETRLMGYASPEFIEAAVS